MPLLSFCINAKNAEISEIVPGVFICGLTSLTAETIASNNISLIINTTSEIPNVKCMCNVSRVKLWWDDEPNTSIYPVLELHSDQIESTVLGGGNVLIHSVAGVSRSAALCLAYLTKFRCKELRGAYLLMAKRRHLVRPNLGFWRQLIAFEQEIRMRIQSVRLVPDECDPDQLIPDVYSINNPSKVLQCTNEKRKWIDEDKCDPKLIQKFEPSLEVITEDLEATII